MIEQSIKPVPASGRLMEDFQFQDWLLRVGLMKRMDPMPEPSFSEGLNAREESICQRSLSNKGYLVSYSQLSGDYHGNSDYGTNGVDRKFYVGTIMGGIKDKMQPTQPIFNAQGLGYGLGISELRIQRENARVLYRLWVELSHGVSHQALALSVLGGEFVTESDQFVTRNHIRLLRKVCYPEPLASIETVRASSEKIGGYMLVERETA